ncbi:helix-turn-helix domain-containing protein [Streptomyces kebangsaanensis]|uniref:Helix-turn-helix domain-containing protein n=1 Tax=Streptomyces kebangsaanensis TaxID=864058 RepID=A0ABW6L2B9_9ACTN
MAPSAVTYLATLRRRPTAYPHGARQISAQDQSVKDITSVMQVSTDHVRDVIHAFNKRGFDALDPKWSGGRPKTIGEQVRERIRLIVWTSLADWGIAAL